MQYNNTTNRYCCLHGNYGIPLLVSWIQTQVFQHLLELYHRRISLIATLIRAPCLHGPLSPLSPLSPLRPIYVHAGRRSLPLLLVPLGVRLLVDVHVLPHLLVLLQLLQELGQPRLPLHLHLPQPLQLPVAPPGALPAVPVELLQEDDVRNPVRLAVQVPLQVGAQVQVAGGESEPDGQVPRLQEVSQVRAGVDLILVRLQRAALMHPQQPHVREDRARRSSQALRVPYDTCKDQTGNSREWRGVGRQTDSAAPS